MDQQSEVNIMSAELAVKRELAYRQKLAGLFPDDDYIKNFLPLEVFIHSSGKSSVSTVNHLSPISNSTFQKPSAAIMSSRNLRSTDLLWQSSISGVGHQCHFPNASCQRQKLSSTPRPGPGPGPVSNLTKVASPQVPSLSYSSKPLPVQDLNHSPWPNPNAAAINSATKEKGTASSFQYPPYQHPQPFHIESGTNLFCKVCKVSCTGSFNYKQHVGGRMHKVKLKMERQSRNSGGTSNLQKPRCNLCQIWCMDEYSLKLHLDGQKHKAKLKEIELHQKGIVPQQQFWCELCQVPCTNEESFRMHLRGKNHIARLHASEKNRTS